MAESSCVHRPIVAGSWGDPVDLGDGTQRITCSGPCAECRATVYRVEVRTAPTDAAAWPVGERLLSAGPWGTADEHEQWAERVERAHARYVAELEDWRARTAYLDDAGSTEGGAR